MKRRDWYQGVFESRAERMAEIGANMARKVTEVLQQAAQTYKGVPIIGHYEHYHRMWHRCGWYATTRCMINRGYTKEQFRLIFPREGFPTYESKSVLG